MSNVIPRMLVSEFNRKCLRKTLKAIHAAGVLHGDLRSWNILIDELGGVSIIDFDRASLHPTFEELREERLRLEALLRGEYVDENPPIGVDDIVSDSEDIRDESDSQ